VDKLAPRSHAHTTNNTWPKRPRDNEAANSGPPRAKRAKPANNLSPLTIIEISDNETPEANEDGLTGHNAAAPAISATPQEHQPQATHPQPMHAAIAERSFRRMKTCFSCLHSFLTAPKHLVPLLLLLLLLLLLSKVVLEKVFY
jgi:hypothetical protein